MGQALIILLQIPSSMHELSCNKLDDFVQALFDHQAKIYPYMSHYSYPLHGGPTQLMLSLEERWLLEPFLIILGDCDLYELVRKHVMTWQLPILPIEKQIAFAIYHEKYPIASKLAESATPENLKPIIEFAWPKVTQITFCNKLAKDRKVAVPSLEQRLKNAIDAGTLEVAKHVLGILTEISSDVLISGFKGCD